MRLLMVMILALGIQAARAEPPDPKPDETEYLLTHGSRTEPTLPLARTKIIHGDTARLDLPAIERSLLDPLPDGFRDGRGLVVALFHVYDEPDLFDEERYLDLYILLPDRDQATGSGARVMAR